MRGARAAFVLLVLVLFPAACAARELGNPVRLTLTNRTGRTVTGAILRFDRTVTRADLVSDRGFYTQKLRIAPANTLRLEGGALKPGRSTVYEIRGDGGPPRPLGGRWLVDGRLGPLLTKDEFDVR